MNFKTLKSTVIPHSMSQNRHHIDTHVNVGTDISIEVEERERQRERESKLRGVNSFVYTLLSLKLHSQPGVSCLTSPKIEYPKSTNGHLLEELDVKFTSIYMELNTKIIFCCTYF